MLPKILGADAELANFLVGVESGSLGTGALAAEALLREIDGVRDRVARTDPQDRGRRYLPGNGGCAYIDLDHLELCVPETRRAHDFLAYWKAMLLIARQAQEDARERLPEGQSIQVLINNSDGLGHSYGSHLNVLMERDAWDRLFYERLDHLLFLSSYQVSSIVFCGQGKVGSENRRAPSDFQLTQRADFIETLQGPQTTWRRPLVNSRDEPLCGNGARLHVIFYDQNLCHVATLLKVGVLQIVLAMLEEDWVPPDLLLRDPLAALQSYGRDPELEARSLSVTGLSLTAVEHQLLFLEEARRFVEQVDLAEIVPGVSEILALWEATLLQLELKDMDSLASRIDWVLKRKLLEGVLAARPDLDWSSPALKHLDQLYASLDARDGLYWCAEREGRVELLVSDRDAARFVREPPADTRAWTRAMLLRASGPGRATELDWHQMRFDHGDGTASRVSLPDPGAHGRDENSSLFARFGLDEVLPRLGARRESIQPPSTTHYTIQGGYS